MLRVAAGPQHPDQGARAPARRDADRTDAARRRAHAVRAASLPPMPDGCCRLVDDLAAAVDADGADVTGELTLGVIPTLAPYVLPTIVPVLTARHPRAELRVRELRTEVLLDELANGTLDLGLIATSDTPGRRRAPAAHAGPVPARHERRPTSWPSSRARSSVGVLARAAGAAAGGRATACATRRSRCATSSTPPPGRCTTPACRRSCRWLRRARASRCCRPAPPRSRPGRATGS